MKISIATKQFYKLATLLSDMANRTMFGLLNPSTEFDFNAGRLSVAGAEDVIFYGSISIADEIQETSGDIFADVLSQFSDITKTKNMTPTNLKKYIALLGEATKIFSLKSKSHPMYGGPRWAKISNILTQITQAYLEYKNKKLRSKKFLNSEDEKKQIYKILGLINVFDGLAHNSGSIYTHMTRFEAINNKRDIGADANYDMDSSLEEGDAPDQYTKIMRIRDLSESGNEAMLLRELEKSMKTLPFENKTRNIRQSPQYFEKNIGQKTEQEINKIKLKKTVKESIPNIIGQLKGDLKTIRSDQIKTNIQFADAFKMLALCSYMLSQIHKALDIIGNYFDSCDNREGKEYILSLLRNLSQTSKSIYTVRNEFSDYIGARNPPEDIKKNFIKGIVHVICSTEDLTKSSIKEISKIYSQI